jgi:hypothetical protein
MLGGVSLGLARAVIVRPERAARPAATSFGRCTTSTSPSRPTPTDARRARHRAAVRAGPEGHRRGRDCRGVPTSPIRSATCCDRDERGRRAQRARRGLRRHRLLRDRPDPHRGRELGGRAAARRRADVRAQGLAAGDLAAAGARRAGAGAGRARAGAAAPQGRHRQGRGARRHPQQARPARRRRGADHATSAGTAAATPDGRAGEEIPVGARVIAVCDTYDAITSKRSYADARSHQAALTELQRCAGSQFDPAAVKAFCAADPVGLEHASLASA